MIELFLMLRVCFMPITLAKVNIDCFIMFSYLCLNIIKIVPSRSCPGGMETKLLCLMVIDFLAFIDSLASNQIRIRLLSFTRLPHLTSVD
jgi:hypothetical protein